MQTSSVAISTINLNSTQPRADYDTLNKLSVKELKAQCKERQLAMTGLKADLIKKLLNSQE